MHVHLMSNLINIIHCINAMLRKWTDREGEVQSYRDCTDTNKVIFPALLQSPPMTLLHVVHYCTCFTLHKCLVSHLKLSSVWCVRSHELHRPNTSVPVPKWDCIVSRIEWQETSVYSLVQKQQTSSRSIYFPIVQENKSWKMWRKC